MNLYGKDKTAIVTGASRGIGRAIALKLAAHGYNLVLNYVNNESEAEKVNEIIGDAGGHAVAVRGDVSKSEDCARIFEAAEVNFGGVDVLVNNAGVMINQTIAETDDAMYAQMFDINTRGAFQMMRLAATKVRPGGRIINISTSAIGYALPAYGIYCASKAAVEMMTKILSKEMRGRDVTVNAVSPGPTSTELFFESKTQAQIDYMTQLSPLGRLGEPDDIASVVAFIASPEGGWVNGQNLRANGGTV